MERHKNLEEIQDGCDVITGHSEVGLAIDSLGLQIINCMRDRVCNENMSGLNAENKLIYAKLRLEGAEAFKLALMKKIKEYSSTPSD